MIIPCNTKESHVWKFKIISYRVSAYFAIGIDSADSHHLKEQFYVKFSNNYAFKANGEYYACGLENSTNKDTAWIVGDIVMMEFNAKVV